MLRPKKKYQRGGKYKKIQPQAIAPANGDIPTYIPPMTNPEYNYPENMIYPPVTVTGFKDKGTADFFNNLKNNNSTFPKYRALINTGRRFGFSKVEMKEDEDMSTSNLPLKDINGNNRAYFRSRNNTAYISKKSSDYIDDYLAELAHSVQFYGEDIEKLQDQSYAEFLKYGDADRYRVPGTIENEAHRVIQPKIDDYYDSMKKYFNDIERKIAPKNKFQKGGRVDSNSIVDYLKSIGQASDKASRAMLAKQFGVEGYNYSAEKNIQLLNLLRNSESADAPVTPKGNPIYRGRELDREDRPTMRAVSTPTRNKGTQSYTQRNLDEEHLPKKRAYAPETKKQDVKNTNTPNINVPNINKIISDGASSFFNSFLSSVGNVVEDTRKFINNTPNKSQYRSPKTTNKKYSAPLPKEVMFKPQVERNISESTNTNIFVPKTKVSPAEDGIIDTVVDYTKGLIGGAKRKLEQVQPEDKRSIVKPKNISIDNNKYGYNELYTVPDVGGNKKDSLVAFTNMFDNTKGNRYLVGPKIKEVNPDSDYINNSRAVAHFLRDGDITPNQRHAPDKWKTVRGYEFSSTSPGKTISSSGLDDPNMYNMLYKDDGKGSYNMRYMRNKDITPELKKEYNTDFTLPSYKFSEIDWDKDGKSTGYAAKSKWVPLKDGRQTSIPYKNKSGFSRFSGGSAIYIFNDPKTGKQIGVDVAGSVNTIREVGEKLIQEYGITPDQLDLLHHDMGSYSAKPKARPDGKLEYNQWKNYNTYNKGFSGAPLIIPKMQQGGYSTQGYKQNSPDKNNPYNIIPSGNITMQNVNHPVMAYPDGDEPMLMQPNKKYMFPNSSKVLEVPVKGNPYMQMGGSMKELYNFLFDDDEDEQSDAPAKAPSAEEVEEQQQFRFGQNQQEDLAMNIVNSNSQNRSRYNERKSTYNPQTGTFDFPATGTYTAEDLVNEKNKYAMEFFQKRGIAPHAAAGIVGNLIQESGNFRDDVIAGTRTGDYGTAFGIAQWRNERKTGLEKFAKTRGINPYTLDAQLEFVLHEGSQRGDIQALANTKTPSEAAYLFAKRYERPKTIDQHRIKFANQMYSKQ